MRIAPLRRYSRGYTGQKGVAFRYIQFDPKEVQDAIEMINQLLEKSNIINLPPFELTQFIRGRLFVLVDFLMTNYVPKKDSAKADIDLILELCKASIKLICKWLIMFPTLSSYVILLLI